MSTSVYLAQELARGREEIRLEPNRPNTRSGLDHCGEAPLVALLACLYRKLERHPVIGAKALSEQLQHLRLRLDPTGGANLAGLGDRDLAEFAMNVQSNLSHLILLR